MFYAFEIIDKDWLDSDLLIKYIFKEEIKTEKDMRKFCFFSSLFWIMFNVQKSENCWFKVFLITVDAVPDPEK